MGLSQLLEDILVRYHDHAPFTQLGKDVLDWAIDNTTRCFFDHSDNSFCASPTGGGILTQLLGAIQLLDGSDGHTL